MTGAAAVLAGFSGLCVIVHGSSGCYYYPRSLLKVPLYSTYLLESEIVFGTVERLREVVNELGKTGQPVAVLNTCVPALTGEDLHAAFADSADPAALLVDAPGFCGNAEEGMRRAYAALAPDVGEECDGVNIEGLSLLDLFCRGNCFEAERLLAAMNVPVAVKFARDSYERLRKGAALWSVSVNPSADAGVGVPLGSLLFCDLPETVRRIEEVVPYANADPVLQEWERAEEQIFYACDKYLRKFSPPVVAVLAQEGYAVCAKQMMERYFGSDVPVVFARDTGAGRIPCSVDFSRISAEIARVDPDLILGSTFERQAFPQKAFFGITPPDRSRISLAARPFAGIEGGLTLMEGALNALMNLHAAKERKK